MGRVLEGPRLFFVTSSSSFGLIKNHSFEGCAEPRSGGIMLMAEKGYHSLLGSGRKEEQEYAVSVHHRRL